MIYRNVWPSWGIDKVKIFTMNKVFKAGHLSGPLGLFSLLFRNSCMILYVWVGITFLPSAYFLS